MSGWRLAVAFMWAGAVGSIIGSVATANRMQPETAWMDSYDFIPDGCRVLRTLVRFDPSTQRPSHEAIAVVCPQWVADEIEAGRRLRP